MKKSIKIIGGYNNATVFGSIKEELALSQIKNMCNEEYLKDERIRIMPDAHAGKGCTIGTTLTYSDKINPSFVSVDIGCGMHVNKLGKVNINLELLDKIINESIPSGRKSNKVDINPYIMETLFSLLKCKEAINCSKEGLALGTLGGGNHFIEIDKDEDNNLYLVIHSGSRHLGYSIAKYYQDKAYEQCNSGKKEGVKILISKLKSKGRHKEIANAIKQYRNDYKMIDKDKCYLSGDLMKDYLNDMDIACEYATFNRTIIANIIMDKLNTCSAGDCFTTVHNYVDTKQEVIRKGAVRALKGEELIIPINMRDGSLLCVGKGNQDWNCSAPHGAGRLFSRTKAKNNFSLADYEKSMEGIYSSSVVENTIDECPMAYKPMQYIIDNIQDTVEIKHILKPIYNFKAKD